ncbi:hypothetical protein EVAR_68204_1 [Eumeta japonica]|uniref:Uncharacterized protein n=1 Tax=Eumeta variegata TaxID=151549 RepID=A0A4C2A5I4_EUMVA|nr:hypothetical protein EVAR_68204_1 [Eumeta japonica]
MLTDEFKEGRPKAVVILQKIGAVQKLIMRDRHVTYCKIKASLGIALRKPQYGPERQMWLLHDVNVLTRWRSPTNYQHGCQYRRPDIAILDIAVTAHVPACLDTLSYDKVCIKENILLCLPVCLSMVSAGRLNRSRCDFYRNIAYWMRRAYWTTCRSHKEFSSAGEYSGLHGPIKSKFYSRRNSLKSVCCALFSVIIYRCQMWFPTNGFVNKFKDAAQCVDLGFSSHFPRDARRHISISTSIHVFLACVVKSISQDAPATQKAKDFKAEKLLQLLRLLTQSEHATLSAWATTALSRAHATKKQTSHPPMFFANHLAIRPTTWVAHEHQKENYLQK